MEYIVKEKLFNGDYRCIGVKDTNTVVLDLFVDASCEFGPEEDIIGKTITVEKLHPYAYFAENVKLKK